MASIILGAAGSAIGSSLGNSIIGGMIGRSIGGILDSTVFGGNTIKHEGARLEELAIQTSTYGKMIPVIYGTVRVAGNIIWSRPIKEIATTTKTTIGGKSGGRTNSSTTQYSYFITMAVAICEGEIDDVLRIWADSKLLDLSQGNYRIYKGSQTQLPDPTIESFEGIGSTPAYRGLAYIVVEDFPLEAFGNRIPNFTFEVKRRLLPNDYNGQSAEDMITSMVMIPGSGEFVYDSDIQYKIAGQTTASGEFAQIGNQIAVNYHNNSGAANSILALNQLQQTCPNIEWIAVVVTWFGDDIDVANCTIKPAVEFQTGAITSPDNWSVAGFTRETAQQITIIDGNPRYGGTPDDSALLRYLDEIKSRGIKIMLYPMFFMDLDNKPWRGRVTGNYADVANFFTKTDGYNNFITHYATLTKDKIDAFVIGSELIGLTKIHDGAATNRNFPAVDALVSLASTVKNIVGNSVLVTYAADWSEYHHTEDGWYNLDPLWSSNDIDFIGIDAYFPLTDKPQNNSYNIQDIIDGWSSGEGYDWYYTDNSRTTKASLAPEYAWKNIEWWWNNYHINPDGNQTMWVPQSKKIWFTEYGFPSVDGASNQPNVFFDPNSQESAFPYHSKGQIDNKAQRVAIAGTQVKWQNSAMIERMFLWTWDARPYPYWPDLQSVWTDGELWRYGHWVQGKFGISGLATIVEDICYRAGLLSDEIDATNLSGHVDGFIIAKQQSARDALEQLQTAFFFDAVESDNRLKFTMRGNDALLTIPQADLLPINNSNNKALLTITRSQDIELPQQISVLYLNKSAQYQLGHQLAQRQSIIGQEKQKIEISVVMEPAQAQSIAETWLYTSWIGRNQFLLELPPKYIALEPTDVIAVEYNNAIHNMRITNTKLGTGNRLQIQAVMEDISTYNNYNDINNNPTNAEITPTTLPNTKLYLLDIPLLPDDTASQAILRYATCPLADGWNGAAIYRSADNGQNFNLITTTTQPAIMGIAIDALESANYAFFDEKSTVTVNLLADGTLSSADELAILNGANAALIGNEIIQFKNAIMQTNGQYTLSGLLRGRLGTEWAITEHIAGERFILLDSNLATEEIGNHMIGLSRRYKAVTSGATLGQSDYTDFIYNANSLKPYAPVHITGKRDINGNLTISWIRRCRLDNSWRDFVDIPLNEEYEAYELEILNGNNIVRTINCTQQITTYNIAEQIEDFGNIQTQISIALYQISAIVGRGYKATAVL